MGDDHVVQEVRGALASGDVVAATLRVLDAYGAEVFGFLAGVLDDIDEAREAYALMGERARERLTTFGCPDDLRTCLYGLACHALDARRSQEDPSRGRTPSPDPLLAPPAAPSAGRRRRPDALARLRSKLPARDRELLVLRVDRRLSWDELATVFLGDDASAGDRVRETLRLRSRYRVIKRWLAREATARGILDGG
jgi:RNA polymerase sigma-70 factor (ECF subfamily)